MFAGSERDRSCRDVSPIPLHFDGLPAGRQVPRDRIENAEARGIELRPCAAVYRGVSLRDSGDGVATGAGRLEGMPMN